MAISMPNVSAWRSYPCVVWSSGMHMEAPRILDPDFGCRRAIAMYGWRFVGMWMGYMLAYEFL